MDESQKGYSKLIIACGDPAENFEFIEKTLDQVTFLVSMKIAKPRLDHIAFGRNGIRCTLFCYIGSNGLRPICLIAQNVAPFDLQFREQIDSCACVMHLSAGEQKLDWVAQRVNNSMDFCGLSTPAGSDKLVVFRIYSPFFAPALCGCALMEVLSMHRFS